MTTSNNVNRVAGSAQEWLTEQQHIADLAFRAQILESEAHALETEADETQKSKLKDAQRFDKELNDLRKREKEIKTGPDMTGATRKVSDLKESTGLNEVERERKSRQEDLKIQVQEDDHIISLRERADQKRQEADQLAGEAESRREQALAQGAAIIKDAANLAELHLV